jgi:fatty acid desaturase
VSEKKIGKDFRFAITGLLICLVGLKLGGELDGWSWWWVLIPFWGPVAAGLFCAMVVGVIACMESKAD